MSENNSIPAKELVLVTGGSGFVASRCIIQLLEAGYQVRTTVRSLDREPEVRSVLKAGGIGHDYDLSFVAADLMLDNGWEQAAEGCDYVLHVASPFPPGVPKNEDELIIPAREGALRILKASRNAGVKRVVLTSSFAAVGYGQEVSELPYTEENWTNLSGRDVTAYVKSKTLAERAAWDFINREGGSLELTVINPVGILGPVLTPDLSASIEIIRRLLNGSVPGYPKLSFGVVDVRDVADLHIRAMKSTAAKGERFLAIAGGFITMQEIGQVLRDNLGVAANKVPKFVLPNWLVKLTSLIDPSIAQIVPELGHPKNASNEKAVRVLGWQPRSREEAILATAESLVRLGLADKK
jgi:nucleoside-diphosphate-sugar epimerase